MNFSVDMIGKIFFWKMINNTKQNVSLIFTWQLELVFFSNTRNGFGNPVTSKMELFMTVLNSWKPLVSSTKSSALLDIAGVLDRLILIGHRGLKKLFPIQRKTKW